MLDCSTQIPGRHHAPWRMMHAYKCLCAHKYGSMHVRTAYTHAHLGAPRVHHAVKIEGVWLVSARAGGCARPCCTPSSLGGGSRQGWYGRWGHDTIKAGCRSADGEGS